MTKKGMHPDDVPTPEIFGHVGTFSSGVKQSSSPRVAMAYNQYPQAIPLAFGNLNPIFQGSEAEIAQYTFGAKAPSTILIKSVIERYKAKRGETHEAPTTSVVFQDLDISEGSAIGNTQDYFDVLEIERNMKNHYKFSHRMSLSPQLWEDNLIEKGTLLSWSNNVNFDVNPRGNHGAGISGNLVYISDYATTEDGILISKEFLDKTTSTVTDSVTSSYGRSLYPINVNGTIEDFKAYPPIGSKVRKDGLLMAFRQVDEWNAAYYLLPDVLTKMDRCHDIPYFVKPGAVVYDIEVDSILNESKGEVPSLHAYEDSLDSDGKSSIKGIRAPSLPFEMCKQPLEDAERQTDYYSNIYETYKRLKRGNGGARFSPRLTYLITRARADRPNVSLSGRNGELDAAVKRTFRAAPLDDFRVKISFRYDFVQGLKTKISNLVGGKGVVCRVVPRSHMPVDSEGNVADIALLDRGNVARLIPWAIQEPYINACARDIRKDMLVMLNADEPNKAYEHMLKFYSYASPPQHDLLLADYPNGQLTPAAMLTLEQVRADPRMSIYIPPDNDWMDSTFFKKMDDFRPPNESPISFINSEGRKVVTKANFIIGEMYFLVLDKSESEAAACSGATNNHYGLPAKKNRLTKRATQTKEQPQRHGGESEVRLWLAMMGGAATRKLLELTTHAQKRRDKWVNIFNAPKPSAMKQIINHDKYSVGGSIPVKIANSLLGVMGIKYIFKDKQKPKNTFIPKKNKIVGREE